MARDFAAKVVRGEPVSALERAFRFVTLRLDSFAPREAMSLVHCEMLVVDWFANY
ncbi:MAG TPA: hypothetical protein VHE81_12320 [Lacipirellulaceae bacterium]|nr:hypothetical protein [Lacipirellulaceae bacterium]